MDYTLIDSHCHIVSDELFERIDEVIANAKANNIERMLIICTNFIDFKRAKELSKKDTMFDIALGFHPNDANNFEEKDYIELEKILKEDEIIALGEIGLDYHYDDVSKEKQKEIFIRQIELANKYHKPIIIHMRDATKDTLDIIKEKSDTTFLMHCFSGSKETAQEIMRMGGYISFAGPITFKNARGLNEIPLVCDLDKILVETDCPYLTPHPFRGKQNEPMYVKYTFEKICAILNVEPKQLSIQIKTNYIRLFNI